MVSGSLIIADLQMFKGIWESDIIQRFVRQSVLAATTEEDTDATNRHQRRGDQAKGRRSSTAAQEIPSETDLVLAILPHLPHSSQFHLVAGDHTVWGSIEAPSMIGSIADLTLKHGAKIPGVWSMVGILDGQPFEVEDLLTVDEMIRVGMTTDNLSKMPLTMAPYVRQMLGRPLMSYGMTPLMVFREVS